VFGSDYPYVATTPQLEELVSVGCSSEELQAIKFDNAGALLNQKTIHADANFK
jgi:predicted TIM-barrel fold metal-dependent hydrolase